MSNKGFDGWADLLGDAVLATALLDRLTHKCQELSFIDDSYRLAHRKQIFDRNYWSKAGNIICQKVGIYA